MATPVSPPSTGPVTLLVATKKGAWFAESDAQRKSWKLQGPHFLGHIIHHVVLDPRDGETLLMAARAGHLGPTVFRSNDRGRSWKESSRPPAFAKAAPGEKGRVVKHVFWLSPGHTSEPGAWYAGTSQEGLFRSEDGGDTWAPVSGFNDHPMYKEWIDGEEDEERGTPDGPIVHSILVDPRDASHLYIGMSGGGVFESTDAGADWSPLNRGSEANFQPDTLPEYGQDPHCVCMHPLDPDLLYQQNHCGIYRMERAKGIWERIGNNMPTEVGDIGFPIVLHPRDRDTAWVFPMDGTDVWPRTSPDGKPAVYATRDGGGSWLRQDRGLPREQAWLTVKRQAMAHDDRDPLGVYFGTTNGELWGSTDEGATWEVVARHLPQIYAVELAQFA